MSVPSASPITKQAVLEEIRVVLVGIGLDPDDIDPAAHLIDDLGLDSLDWVDLAMSLEETFPIALREDRFTSISTIQNLIDRIHSALLDAPLAPN